MDKCCYCGSQKELKWVVDLEGEPDDFDGFVCKECLKGVIKNG